MVSRPKFGARETKVTSQNCYEYIARYIYIHTYNNKILIYIHTYIHHYIHAKQYATKYKYTQNNLSTKKKCCHFCQRKSSKLFSLIIALSVCFVFSCRGVYVSKHICRFSVLYSFSRLLHTMNFVNVFTWCLYFPELYNFQDSFFVCYNVYSLYFHHNSLCYCMVF